MDALTFGVEEIKPTFPIYHPNSWKSYHFPTAKGTVSPMQPSDGMILVIGPRLEGHSVIFLAIQTHLSCRFLLAVDSLGLRRSGSSSQIINVHRPIAGNDTTGRRIRDRVEELADRVFAGIGRGGAGFAPARAGLGAQQAASAVRSGCHRDAAERRWKLSGTASTVGLCKSSVACLCRWAPDSETTAPEGTAPVWSISPGNNATSAQCPPMLILTDIPHIPSKFVEIAPLSHRQGNCIPYAAIRWHDFGNRPALGRPLGHFSRHPDTPLLSLSPRRRFPRPTPERVFVADHQSSSGFSGTGPSAPPPQPIGT